MSFYRKIVAGLAGLILVVLGLFAPIPATAAKQHKAYAYHGQDVGAADTHTVYAGDRECDGHAVRVQYSVTYRNGDLVNNLFVQDGTGCKAPDASKTHSTGYIYRFRVQERTSKFPDKTVWSSGAWVYVPGAPKPD